MSRAKFSCYEKCVNAEKPHKYALFWLSGGPEIIKNLSKVVQDFAQLFPKLCRFSAQLVQDFLSNYALADDKTGTLFAIRAMVTKKRPCWYLQDLKAK